MPNILSFAFHNISWLWFAVSVVVVFALSGFWYSKLFAKQWVEAFRVEIPADGKVDWVLPFAMQIISILLLGFAMFLVTKISPWLAVIVLCAFCAWRKAALKFQIADWRHFVKAASVEVGHSFLCGLIFLLFALI